MQPRQRSVAGSKVQTPMQGEGMSINRQPLVCETRLNVSSPMKKNLSANDKVMRRSDRNQA